MRPPPRLVVVGSSNTDMVIRSGRLPRPGESVVAGQFYMAPVGKGANQARAIVHNAFRWPVTADALCASARAARITAAASCNAIARHTLF